MKCALTCYQHGSGSVDGSLAGSEAGAEPRIGHRMAETQVMPREGRKARELPHTTS